MYVHDVVIGFMEFMDYFGMELTSNKFIREGGQQFKGYGIGEQPEGKKSRHVHNLDLIEAHQN